MAYRRPISVIPNPIPTDLAAVHRAPTDPPVILEVADASPRKNVWTLIRAFKDVRAYYPRARLRLVGDGLGEGSPMSTRAKSEGLAEGVMFLGRLSRSGVVEQLSIASVFAHVSFEEWFGSSVLEAVTAGLPTLGGKNSGAIPYVLGGGEAGLLVDVSKPTEVSRGILELLGGTAGPQGRSQVQFARRHFDGAVVCRQYINWYSRTLGF